MDSQPAIGDAVFVGGRCGEVVLYDQDDPALTYKVSFGDGTADWFRQEDVCIASTDTSGFVREVPKASNSEEFNTKLMAVRDKLIVKSGNLKAKTVTLIQSPKFKTFTVVTAEGTVCFAAVGGAFGTASGMVVGSAVGAIPALLTLGLSIPAGAVIGGSTGMCVGTATGTGVGVCASYPLYHYCVGTKLQNGAEEGLRCVKVTLDGTKKKALTKVNETKTKVEEFICFSKTKAGEIVCYTKTEAGRIAKVTKFRTGQTMEIVKAKKSEIITLATTTRPGVTGTAAATGAVVGGTTGATIGTVAGAAVGVVPALFTFGLSIPIFAATGFCTGAVAGTTTGAVGGAAAGYGGFTYRKEISSRTQGVISKAKAKVKEISDSGTTCWKPSMRSLGTNMLNKNELYIGPRMQKDNQGKGISEDGLLFVNLAEKLRKDKTSI